MKISMRELGKYFVFSVGLMAAVGFAGCNAPNSGTLNLSSTEIGAQGCGSNDPNHICIGLKVVSYTNAGKPALSSDQAVKLVNGMNNIWKQCDIAFQIEQYTTADPSQYGMSYGAESENELTQIRQTFSDDKTFLLAATGTWNTATIAWTEMPGAAPYGAVVDAEYATDPVTVGHELGHYMGLDHDNTTGNLMYPIAYSNDTAIDQSQCDLARSTDLNNWKAMLR